ncbi:hypothetical protein [Chondromyces crocatus]|uniref:Uncharacterized protein n=1 Tax=Chondromyces crocatus TaxID=52 RepID=A0A0K1E7M0_CHOCO|nr:hypothetical protein [Chondromyces crocatus]AKT36672.1 uncharacterized protein CMC5_007920 [Chondromyces crocatus]
MQKTEAKQKSVESSDADDDAQEMRGAQEEALQGVDPGQVLETVTTFARENPHTALAVAAGVGFVLGGGLTPRLLGAIGLFVARQYMRETMNEALQGSLMDRLAGSDAGSEQN